MAVGPDVIFSPVGLYSEPTSWLFPEENFVMKIMEVVISTSDLLFGNTKELISEYLAVITFQGELTPRWNENGRPGFKSHPKAKQPLMKLQSGMCKCSKHIEQIPNR